MTTFEKRFFVLFSHACHEDDTARWHHSYRGMVRSSYTEAATWQPIISHISCTSRSRAPSTSGIQGLDCKCFKCGPGAVQLACADMAQRWQPAMPPHCTHPPSFCCAGAASTRIQQVHQVDSASASSQTRNPKQHDIRSQSVLSLLQPAPTPAQ